jgi:hypothetical protein
MSATPQVLSLGILLAHRVGNWKLNRPNMERANKAIRLARKISTQGFCNSDPNTAPVTAATVPSVVYTTAIPKAYKPARPILFRVEIA